MKKLLVLILAGIPLSLIAEFSYNELTHKFYSKHASRKVNQEEYNQLVVDILNHYPQGFLNISVQQQAAIFVWLKKIDSYASKQLLKDLQAVLRQFKKELSWIKS